MRKGILFLFLLCGLTANAQGLKLPTILREISGLERLDDTSFVAINDGGNHAELYVIDHQGKLLKTVQVKGAENVDWEDLTSDGTHLYIGDFGNNLNERRDLCVYKVLLSSIRENTRVEAKKISFSYAEQREFPPKENEKRYDAEGFACYKGKLWIFTKINDDPWSGKSLVYELPTEPGSYTLKISKAVFIGNDGWWVDAITAVDQHDGKFYISTYNRILKMEFQEGKPVILASYSYPETSQKESILVDGSYLWVADEYQSFLGGGKLYKIPLSELKRVNKTK